MYVGHFAIGAAVKAARPRLPRPSILPEAAFMDVVDGRRVTPVIDPLPAPSRSPC